MADEPTSPASVVLPLLADLGPDLVRITPLRRLASLADAFAPWTPIFLVQTRAFRGVIASVLAVEHLYHLEHHLRFIN